MGLRLNAVHQRLNHIAQDFLNEPAFLIIFPALLPTYSPLMTGLMMLTNFEALNNAHKAPLLDYQALAANYISNELQAA